MGFPGDVEDLMFIMKKVSRAEKALEKLAQRTGMTAQGLEWLKCAIDPFHDGRLEVRGFPDGAEGSSITQCVKQQLHISKPTVYPNSNWDAHIYFTPTSNTRTLTLVQAQGSYTQAAVATASMQLGGVTILGMQPGGNLSVVNTADQDTKVLGNIPIPSTYQKKRWRLIAVGIEVHDTTAPLNKQGACTVYALPQNSRTYSTDFNGTGQSSRGFFDVTLLSDLPHTLSQVQLLEGSVTWEAAKGAYIVPTLNSGENPPDFNRPTAYMMSDQQDQYYPLATSITGYMTQVNQFTVGASTYAAVYPEHTHNFNTKGVVLTGLNSASTFTVNVNYWIERFPHYADSDLVVLAQPTAEHDPMALEAYARIMSIMPVGVEVSENGFGDWFLGGVATIVDSLTGTKWAGNLLKAGDSFVGSSQEKKHVEETRPSQQNNNSPNKIGRKINAQGPTRRQGNNSKPVPFRFESSPGTTAKIVQMQGPKIKNKKGRNSRPVEYVVLPGK